MTHWILTTPEGFSLSYLLQRSSSLILPPFHSSYNGDLDRVERLSSGRTVRFSISEASAGVQVRVDERLSAEEREELSRKAWRMLRLGEDFRDFFALLEESPMRPPLSHPQEGARFLRGTTLLEDMVKAFVLTTRPLTLAVYRLSQLVEQLGDPWPSNPTRHAFPSAVQILQAPRFLYDILGKEAGTELRALLAAYLAAEKRLLTLERRDFSSVVVAAQFQVLPGITECRLALIMFSLGHYAYIPSDLCAWSCWHRKPAPEGVDAETIAELCAPWQPWGGLVYLLWDWNRLLDPTYEGHLALHN